MKHPINELLLAIAATAFLLSPRTSWGADPEPRVMTGVATITLESLLGEMVDRDHLARLPEPAYVTGQASSYDRAFVTPDKPGWFANHDTENYVRTETRQGRTERVMMDVAGPGAIVRWWEGDHDAKEGTIRIYFDGAETPAIEENIETFLSGTGTVRPPLAAVRCLGLNFYLPLPYSRHCKITYDKGGLHWYNIEYRTYPAGTAVKTLARSDLDASASVINRVQQTLSAPTGGDLPIRRQVPLQTRELAPGAAMQMTLNGPAAVRLLPVLINTRDARDLPQALRSTVISMICDGEMTVWCPVGDFFGSGVGLNPYRDWYREVDRSGLLRCAWVMPFGKSCRIELKNLGEQPIDATLGPIGVGDWAWDERSMLFHATWRQEYPIQTRRQEGTCDWNFVEVAGRGVYVGDTLAIHNGCGAWWGEGDEKIWVDGESFPSHFGTGTEDYYGYSYGDRGVFFQGPFQAEPRWEGNRNRGHVTNTRTRSLDTIPFTKSLKLDLEIWHWEATTMAYAAASYWYARPGATCNRPPEANEAARPIPPGPPPEGIVEGESARILRKTGGVTEVQTEARWSGGQQLWWRDGKPGDRLEVALPVAKAGTYRLVMNNTRASDYGIFQFTLDGEKLGEAIDLYSKVNTDKQVALGTRALKAGEHVFGAEIVGANPDAVKRYMLGLDYLKLELLQQ